jgi:hypothetical protein
MARPRRLSSLLLLSPSPICTRPTNSRPRSPRARLSPSPTRGLLVRLVVLPEPDSDLSPSPASPHAVSSHVALGPHVNAPPRQPYKYRLCSRVFPSSRSRRRLKPLPPEKLAPSPPSLCLGRPLLRRFPPSNKRRRSTAAG